MKGERLTDVAKGLEKDKSTVSLQHKRALEKASGFLRESMGESEKARVASKAFAMLEKGSSLTSIVIKLKASPSQVREIYGQWIRLREEDL